jgi:hypothetical protein
MVIVLVLRHPLRHDEMVLAHRDLRRVTQHETPAPAQKTWVRIGDPELLLAALAQMLQLLAQLCDLFRPHTRSRIAIQVAVQFLLPAFDFLAQLPLELIPAQEPIEGQVR